MATIAISLIQTRCTADREANIEQTITRIQESASAGAQVICLQELFSTSYFCQEEKEETFALAEPVEGPTIQQLSDLAKQLAIVIVVPWFEKIAPGVFYNSAAVLDIDGSVAGLYRKMHIPDDPQFSEKYYFSPGNDGFSATKTAYGKIGVCICWDQWFPEAARLTAMAGAEIIFYPTAIGWLPHDLEAGMGEDQCDAWRTMQRSHAIANGCFVAAANRVGIEHGANGDQIQFWGNSFVANPAGRIIAEGNSTDEAIVTAEIDLAEIEIQRIQWPFFRDRRIDAYNGLLNRFGK